MTTIDEELEMDFVNWDAADAATGSGFDLTTGPNIVDEEDFSKLLEDADGDDWSFWALQHFETSQVPEDPSIAAFADPLATLEEPPLSALYWEHPPEPCQHCALGGYQCKLIQEGRYKGYCTSCVALRCGCSFAPDLPESALPFPANPWPTMGPRPETTLIHEDHPTNPLHDAMKQGVEAQGETKQASPKANPKIGARFSRESVRVLRNWVSTHNRHPYPSEEEKESLQKITGLNKVQITNWLANARRRGKIQPTRSTSPHVGRGYASAIDIPKRRGTPGPVESMNPLQRWENSPPEHEPASVTAIARAVTASSSNLSSSSGRNSPYVSGYSDDGSSRSLCNQSSASSFSNSNTHGSSGGSFASSHRSRGSLGSIPSFVRSNRGRRRRRRAPPKRAEETFQQPLKTFQCTFCTETFRTKHDWQRHEKSLHLSLERWVCSPDGGTAINPGTGQICCVFCGEANPDDMHLESHNYSGCTERKLEERTFYRKDHIRQHLKLVHNVKFLPWAMDKWRVSSPEIRSRCGFCGVVMETWTKRVDHLAEHFKTGYTMAEWKGDWGFDGPVLDMVENSIPPYLIHDERNSPLPYMASASSPSTPTNAYELLKMELQYWIMNYKDEHGQAPTDLETQHEACRIFFSAEAISESSNPKLSWLHDLVASNAEVTKAAMFRPIRSQAENKISKLRINGKDNIFEDCELEMQLQEFVKARQLLGLTAMDQEMQLEACRILGRMEEKSRYPSDEVANWLIHLINGSATWLTDFRRRAGLPRSDDVSCSDERSKDRTTIDSTVHNYSRLDHELGEFLQTQRSLGSEPTDADLQRQARIIIYEHDDAWNQTAADDAEWLMKFKGRYLHRESGSSGETSTVSPAGPLSSISQPTPSGTDTTGPMTNMTNASAGISHSTSTKTSGERLGPYFINDANCYRRLAKGLTRFAASMMSANNPNRHIPTDEELQHQARWIAYDDDDPWNQTAADNTEWLLRFKRDVGIVPPDSGPGLPDNLPWSANEGGTGFAPPYLVPNPQKKFVPLEMNPTIFCRDDAKPFELDAATANRYLQTFTQRYPPPAKVFCSRELENGLTEYVKREFLKTSSIPDDEAMRQRAREIMSMQKTPCDDPLLLAKFREIVQPEAIASFVVPMTTAAPTVAGMATSVNPLSTISSSVPAGMNTATTASPEMLLPIDMDLTLTDQEMENIIQGVNEEFGEASMFNSSPVGQTSGSSEVSLG